MACSNSFLPLHANLLLLLQSSRRSNRVERHAHYLSHNARALWDRCARGSQRSLAQGAEDYFAGGVQFGGIILALDQYGLSRSALVTAAMGMQVRCGISPPLSFSMRKDRPT
jgi:hypothetical protein